MTEEDQQHMKRMYQVLRHIASAGAKTKPKWEDYEGRYLLSDQVYARDNALFEMAVLARSALLEDDDDQ
jgi:hypothetical protein